MYRLIDLQTVNCIESVDENDSDLSLDANESYLKIKNRFFGQNKRMKNIDHIKNGFIKFMNEYEKKLLENCFWDEIELLCCGPEIITSEMILSCMEDSLSDQIWYSNQQTIQTKEWLISWVKSQNSNALRKFLQFATGLSSIPTKFDHFRINVIPIERFIRSNTCFYQVHIGTSCLTKDQFFEMLKTSLDFLGQIED